MNRILKPGGTLLLAITVVLCGCAKSTTTTDSATTPAPAVATDASVAQATDAPTADPSPVASATTAAVASATPAAVALSDIAGVNGQQEITELAQLGVVEPTSGAFRPGVAVKRREFIRWLVKANNALWKDTPAKRVALADTTETSSFPDIKTTDPDFPYVQGMQDAGYSVGFPDKTFKPEQALTREQMFAIKNTFDRGSVDPGLVKDLNFARNTVLPPWKDKPSISKTYVAAIATGSNGGLANFSLVYGASSLFHPQLAVTRAQAAVAVSQIGDHSFYGGAMRTAAGAVVALSASPSP